MDYIGDIKYTPGVYCIRNTINNKRYIGSTINLYSRFNTHKNNLINNKHVNKYLQNAFNKYLKFNFYVLEETSKEDLELKETFYINKYKTNYREFGYNLRIVTKSNRGIKYSEEVRLKISLAMQGKVKRPRTPEEKAKISKACKGRKLTKETRKKISINHSKHTLGKKASLDTKLKMSKSHKGKSHSKEALINRSKSMQGKNAKLNSYDIMHIKRTLVDGIPNKILAEVYKVNPVTISNIKNGKTWKHIK